MKVSVFCIVPLSKRASQVFQEKNSSIITTDALSGASIHFEERYSTLKEDNKILSNLFTQFTLGSENNSNLAISKSNHDTIVLKIIYEFELLKIEQINDLSEKCNNYCNKYIADLLQLDDSKIHYLWVNRTLVIDFPNDEIMHHIQNQWLMTECDVQAELKLKKYILCWGNNIVLKSFTHFDELFQSLIMMQFNYIILDGINIELTHQMEYIANLATINRKVKNTELKTRKQTIQELQKKVERALIEINDELINLQSFKQIYHDKIKEVWQINTLINSCRNKLKFCLEEVNTIDKELEDRANFQADILLFIIGLFGLLSYFLDLSQIFDQFNTQQSKLFETIFYQSSFGMMQSLALLLSTLAIIHFIIRRR
ncbi:TPA: hypothetical protein ACGO6R_001620 [Streptococcus suis]